MQKANTDNVLLLTVVARGLAERQTNRIRLLLKKKETGITRKTTDVFWSDEANQTEAEIAKLDTSLKLKAKLADSGSNTRTTHYIDLQGKSEAIILLMLLRVA